MTTYNIVCVADESYAQHAAVLLVSLFETNKTHQFDVYLFTFMMTEETKKKLHELVQYYGQKIHIIEDTYNLAHLDQMNTATSHKSWNSIIYFKLFILRYLPCAAMRCLFLDVDMVIRTDIAPLYEMDLRGAVIAGCEDYLYSISHRERLHLKYTAKYINSGVMVIDLAAWQKMEAERPMVDFLHSVKTQVSNEQDVIALYFQNHIIYIHYKWNATTFCFQRIPRIFPKYSPQLDEVRNHPCIIHFCEPVKPWFRECKHPYKWVYRKYLSLTPWKKDRFPSCKRVGKLSARKYLLRYWLNRLRVLKDFNYEIPIQTNNH